MTPRARIICECLKVTEHEVLQALKGRVVRTLKELIRHTGAGDGCTACHPLLREYLERQRGGRPCAASPSSRLQVAPSGSSPSLSA